MSTKTPDVLIKPPSPQTAFTLAEMHVLRWELKARCSKCSLHLRVSLPAMIKTHGPDAIWWGQHPNCPGYECEKGELTYSARSIKGGTWVAMNFTPAERDIQIWKNNRPAYRGPR